MGELILCKQPIAANPFYLEEMSLNIYSLEELSYLIHNNVYLLNSDFISTDICHWIGRELGQKELEKQLLDAIKDNVPLHVFVGHILVSSAYLTKQEIRSVLEIITSFENKSEIERRKMRADRLMSRKKYIDAIYEYEDMLDSDVLKKGAREFEGDVWHNLGVAYAKLFFFDEAAHCFEEAYIRNRKVISMRQMLASYRCNKNERRFEEAVRKFFIPEDVVNAVKEEVSAISRQEEIAEFDKRINELLERNDNAERFDDEARALLEKWKAEYNRLCRI